VLDVCRLGPGSRVLEVGGGWGSFGTYAAARGIDVDMLTISHEQFAFLSDLGTQERPGRLQAVYEDVFRYGAAEQDDKYDAIVLLGVMEHLPDYPRLFRTFERLLKPGGRVYMDFVANRAKFAVNTFTYLHVFPGNHTPVVIPDLLDAANRTSFEPIVLHNDRHSYFLTLQAWARRLEAAEPELVRRFTAATYRLFQLYLWGGAQQLRQGTLESYRVVLQRAHREPSPTIGAYRPV
jgi:cyclopropane-fatty-acyl-phospholipid synthase